MQTRRLLDIQVVDAGVPAHVYIGQRTLKAGPARHIAISRVGQVQETADVARRGVGLLGIERHRESDWNTFPAQVGRHFHHRISAKRMPYNDDRTFLAGVIGGGSVVG